MYTGRAQTRLQEPCSALVFFVFRFCLLTFIPFNPVPESDRVSRIYDSGFQDFPEFQKILLWFGQKWHPDRFSEPGDREEAKKEFQSVQRSYSVLSDTNKRLLYDVGAYDSDDDDDELGMGDFLNEMLTMMDQHKSTGEETLEELQELLEELFEDEMDPSTRAQKGKYSY
ncbi:PREDICTED: uncharacterized protein LOC104814045 isoform X1 [Tarenaya hassleriana]|uniref:uncharacterized protein LOC104814045 isoform X1 n=1 Tax=Tarenaya hassleriana TaxID=28532 RepID=UPI0008FD59B1|nr:PREDICTED: uncharacterized protein LOC104814045 isoform X1 [Tarenaya hassleriana]